MIIRHSNLKKKDPLPYKITHAAMNQDFTIIATKVADDTAPHAKWLVAGKNTYGQLGTGDTSNRLTLTQVPMLGPAYQTRVIRHLAIGSNHTIMGARHEGTHETEIFTCGRNNSGQLSPVATGVTVSPNYVYTGWREPAEDIVSISANADSSVLTTYRINVGDTEPKGKYFGAGFFSPGSAPVIPIGGRLCPTFTDLHTGAIDRWSFIKYKTGLTDGSYSAMFISSILGDNLATATYALGINDHGVLGLGDTDLHFDYPIAIPSLSGKFLVDLSFSSYVGVEPFFTVALDRDGRVYASGLAMYAINNDNDTRTNVFVDCNVNLPSKVTHIATGFGGTLVGLANGEVWGKGDNHTHWMGNANGAVYTKCTGLPVGKKIVSLVATLPEFVPVECSAMVAYEDEVYFTGYDSQGKFGMNTFGKVYTSFTKNPLVDQYLREILL